MSAVRIMIGADTQYTEQDYWLDNILRCVILATGRLEEELIKRELVDAFLEHRPLRNILLPCRWYEELGDSQRFAALAQVEVEHVYL